MCQGNRSSNETRTFYILLQWGINTRLISSTFIPFHGTKIKSVILLGLGWHKGMRTLSRTFYIVGQKTMLVTEFHKSLPRVRKKQLLPRYWKYSQYLGSISKVNEMESRPATILFGCYLTPQRVFHPLPLIHSSANESLKTGPDTEHDDDETGSPASWLAGC